MDYKQMNIYPTANELRGQRIPLRKNIVEGKFNSINDYIDIHFKLLREDFVACLRDGIHNYRLKEPLKKFDIYKCIKLFKERNVSGEECWKIRIPLQSEDSKKFMNGSLLIFTKDDFTSMSLAKVIRRDIERSEVTIEFVNICNSLILSDYFMVAEGTYFDPYFQVLSVLQTMTKEDFPMEKYIIQVDTSSVYIPRYLLTCNSSYNIGGYRFPASMLLKFNENCLNLNDAQFKAFKAALSQEFVVIQGPPGTGKTFLGLKIVETLIRNHIFWYKNSPILVVSQKNFALDQFLEGLIPITNQLVRIGGQSKSEKLKKYNLMYEKNEGRKRSPKDYLSTMRNALVIGTTTSLAARYKSMLEDLKCPIVIVEEAAEVLEAHVIASLTRHCQHLILLGDHQQLQPITSDYSIGKQYNLGISLFERMIKNGIQCYRLNIQHRMRPEISSLLKVKIYPFLLDHESVLGRSSILGVDRNVFFLDHQSPEESCNVTSKKNSHEAEFIVAFAIYLILNGYKPSEIVILAAYGGQIQEFEKIVKKLSFEQVKEVKIMTLDAFQGRECDIVLLSLVANQSIGFLSAQNRVCVALSRAKNGLYMFGNMELFSKKSQLWNEVNKCLKRQDSVGEYLPLRCQIHKNTVTKVKCARDFLAVRYGGCDRKCDKILTCGHQCQYNCHMKYKEHKCVNHCKKSTTYTSYSHILPEQNYVYNQNYGERNTRVNTRLNYVNPVDYRNVNERNSPFSTFINGLKQIGRFIFRGLRSLFTFCF